MTACTEPRSRATHITVRSAITKNSPAGRSRLNAIECMRGLAAGLVVIGHVLDDGMHFGFIPVATPAAWPIWNGGVDIFFVISGFIMIWTFGDRFGESGAAWDFAIRRFTRIVPLYWLMTSLTAVGLVLAPHLFDKAEYRLDHYILSLAFLPHQAPAGGIWPIMPVGWTLNYEMLFYVIFAVGLLFRVTAGLSVVFATLCAAYLGARILGPPTVTFVVFLADSVMLEFLAGIGLGLLVRRYGLNRSILISAAVAALLLGAVLSLWFSEARFARAAPPAFAVVAVAMALYPTGEGWSVRWASALGAASYSLYLSHTLVINLVRGSLQGSVLAAELPSGLAFGIYAVLAVMLSIATALLLHRWVERPVQRICRRHARAASGASGAQRADMSPGLLSVSEVRSR